MKKFARDLSRQWANLSKRDQILIGALGTVAATVVVGGVTYGLASAFGSPWPGLRDSTCPVEYYESVLGEHNVGDATIERAWTYMPLVRYAAAQWGIEAALLAGLVHTESNWNPQAGSGAGAVGLTQMISSTAISRFETLSKRGQWPFGRLSSNNDPQANGKLADVSAWLDRTDPHQSLWLSASLLSSLLSDHDLDWALAAYNGGPGVANEPASQRPAETQAYVPSVLRHRDWYRELEAACQGGVLA